MLSDHLHIFRLFWHHLPLHAIKQEFALLPNKVTLLNAVILCYTIYNYARKKLLTDNIHQQNSLSLFYIHVHYFARHN